MGDLVNVDEFVATVVASAPPLTAEQLDRIAVILRPLGACFPPPGRKGGRKGQGSA